MFRPCCKHVGRIKGGYAGTRKEHSYSPHVGVDLVPALNINAQSLASTRLRWHGRWSLRSMCARRPFHWRGCRKRCDAVSWPLLLGLLQEPSHGLPSPDDEYFAPAAPSERTWQATPPDAVACRSRSCPVATMLAPTSLVHWHCATLGMQLPYVPIALLVKHMSPWFYCDRIQTSMRSSSGA